MNAYELADELQELDSRLHLIDLFKSANMLRQQADRIAELEKGGEVAGRFYWESVVDGHVMAVPSEGTPHYNKDDFPLYTTPQIKEFTQAELKEIVENNTKYDYVDYFNLALDMNKAILKKASEK